MLKVGFFMDTNLNYLFSALLLRLTQLNRKKSCSDRKSFGDSNNNVFVWKRNYTGAFFHLNVCEHKDKTQDLLNKATTPTIIS